MQINILKIMIEAYEKGINIQMSLGMASGKTTVMKIFKEYVRLKKENPNYKFDFSKLVIDSEMADFEIFEGPSTPINEIRFKCIPLEPRVSLADYYKIETESGPINNAMIEEVKKRLKK